MSYSGLHGNIAAIAAPTSAAAGRHFLSGDLIMAATRIRFDARATHASLAALAVALAAPAGAQDTLPPRNPDQSGAPTVAAPAPRTSAEQRADSQAEDNGDEVTVTGSRIERAGFNQPTPTTVLGDVELRQGARANVAQVLNDQPAFRATVSPTVSVGNTSSGTAPVDLRGLGTARTLTLLNGRRFVGEGNLNLIPSGLVQRVEVVTGGASAAYGSGAVSGVVNILLNKELTGLTLGGSGGVSSRGDGARYSLDGTYGLSFADGRGHLLFGAEYVKDRGIPDRNSRPNLGSTSLARVNPTSTTDLRTFLVQDVNYTNRSRGGYVIGGVLNGQTFNQDGTLRPFQGPNAQGVGGADGIGLYDDVYAGTPFQRHNAYARVSYEVVPGATLWIDGTYGRAKSVYPFFPDLLLATQAISATNPFLLQQYRQQLAAAGQTSITVGRVFNDIFQNTFNIDRENREGAVGVDGDLGGSFKYNAWFSYGTVEDEQRVTNSRIAANYTRAINAVTNAAGQIVCAVNADAITTNDAPACAPLNILGSGAASAAALAYVRGVQSQRSLSTLASGGFQIQGDVIPLWAGPLTVALGFEGRLEKLKSVRDPLTATPGYFGFQLYAQDLRGQFDVREGFAEAALPLINIDRKIKVDLNGAARYSDYSTSGGIWSWKVGGTARLFDALLLRGTRSRDIRSPSIGNLFSTRATNIGLVSDRDNPQGRQAANPLYNPNPTQVFTYSGGNPLLIPEIGHTTTLGGSFTPGFLRGFSVSVDYFDIKIDRAITTLTGSNLTLACFNGNQAACDRVIRDANGTITTVFANAQNIASFKTNGVDIEAAYTLPLSELNGGWGGTLRMRALATYVDKLIINDGTTAVDRAGAVGNTVAGIPKWRGTFSATYQDSVVGLDARVRYVDGGLFDNLSAVTTVNGVTTGIANNRYASRTYLDLGAQIKAGDRFTFFSNINNVFDRKPPLSTAGPVHYDAVGTYFTFGARAKF